jgi:hypothetical protein
LCEVGNWEFGRKEEGKLRKGRKRSIGRSRDDAIGFPTANEPKFLEGDIAI